MGRSQPTEDEKALLARLIKDCASGKPIGYTSGFLFLGPEFGPGEYKPSLDEILEHEYWVWYHQYGACYYDYYSHYSIWCQHRMLDIRMSKWLRREELVRKGHKIPHHLL